MDAKARERIERLRGHYNSTYDVMLAFMGWDLIDASRDCKAFQTALIDLLERSDPDEWTDGQLRDYGLVRLPRDKDGEFVYPGDTVWDSDGNGCTVESIECTCSGQWYAYCVRVVGYTTGGNSRPTSEITHHPPATVESVLREFGDKYIQVVESPNPIVGFGNEIIGEEDPENTIAEYAKRLRLAGYGE